MSIIQYPNIKTKAEKNQMSPVLFSIDTTPERFYN